MVRQILRAIADIDSIPIMCFATIPVGAVHKVKCLISEGFISNVARLLGAKARKPMPFAQLLLYFVYIIVGCSRKIAK